MATRGRKQEGEGIIYRNRKKALEKRDKARWTREWLSMNKAARVRNISRNSKSFQLYCDLELGERLSTAKEEFEWGIYTHKQRGTPTISIAARKSVRPFLEEHNWRAVQKIPSLSRPYLTGKNITRVFSVNRGKLLVFYLKPNTLVGGKAQGEVEGLLSEKFKRREKFLGLVERGNTLFIVTQEKRNFRPMDAVFRDFKEGRVMVRGKKLKGEQLYREVEKLRHKLIESAAREIGEVHKRGAIHGDFKPGNLLVDLEQYLHDGRLPAVFIDFADHPRAKIPDPLVDLYLFVYGGPGGALQTGLFKREQETMDLNDFCMSYVKARYRRQGKALDSRAIMEKAGEVMGQLLYLKIKLPKM